MPSYSISAIGDMFAPSLSREKIYYFWKEKKWIRPTKRSVKSGFSADHCEKIALLLQAQADGLTLEAAHKRISAPNAKRELYRREDFESIIRSLLSESLPAEALHRLMIAGRTSLQSEHCSLLLVDDSKTSLVLSADSLANRTRSRAGLLRITLDDENPSVTVRALRSPDGVSQFLPRADDVEFPDSSKPTHLSAHRVSVIAAPLFNHKGQPIGVLKAENKQGTESLKTRAFDAADRYHLSVMTDMLATTLELQSVANASMSLARHSATATDFTSFAKAFLGVAGPATGATLGEITIWDNEERHLRVVAVLGENTLKIDSRIDKTSISLSALKHNQPRLVQDAHDKDEAPDYLASNSSTRSEITIPITSDEIKLGVANIESDKTAKDGGLSHTDFVIMRRLGDHLSTAGRLFRVMNMIAKSCSNKGALEAMLAEVAERTRFDQAIAYIANYMTGELHTEAFQGCVPSSRTVRFDGKYLASKVFRERKPHVSKHPEIDPDVSPEGLRAYSIAGSLSGTPITFGSTHDSMVVGACVLWTSTGHVFSEADVSSDLEVARRICTFDASRASSGLRKVVGAGG